MGEKPKAKEPIEPEEKKKQTHIPLIPMPNDAQELEEEMQEVFQEDQVTHKHGGTEPERD